MTTPTCARTRTLPRARSARDRVRRGRTQYQLFIDGKKVAPDLRTRIRRVLLRDDRRDPRVRAGGENAIGVLHYWYGPGQRPSGLATRTARADRCRAQERTREVIATMPLGRTSGRVDAPRATHDEGGFTSASTVGANSWAGRAGLSANGWTSVRSSVRRGPGRHAPRRATHATRPSGR